MADPVEPTAGIKALCENCSAPREAGAAFCEVCGLDFTTGKLPAAPPPPTQRAADEGWVVVVAVDEEFFARIQPEDATLTVPASTPDRELPLRGDEALIGRSRGDVHPDIDLIADAAVSRRHAVLKRAGDAWVVVDQGSTNGTQVDGKQAPAGEEVAVTDGSVIHVGAFTRLTLKRAPTA